MQKQFTGLLDRNCEKIYVGDWIKVGTRRGNAISGDEEQVLRKRSKLFSLFKAENWSEYQLVNKEGERMDMQLDQELREKICPQPRDAIRAAMKDDK